MRKCPYHEVWSSAPQEAIIFINTVIFVYTVLLYRVRFFGHIFLGFQLNRFLINLILIWLLNVYKYMRLYIILYILCMDIYW